MSEIAVIGAGVIGLTTALRLLGDGHNVTLVAPAVEPHMASSGNAGTIADYAIDPVATPEVLWNLPSLLFNPQSPLAIHHASALSLVPWLARFAWQALPAQARRNRGALVPLLAGVAGEWRALAQAVGGEALLRAHGALYAYDTPGDLREAKAGLDRRRLHGVAVELIGAEELERLEPALPGGRFAGGAHFPGTIALSDPGRMLDLIAASFQAQGGARIDARVQALAQTRTGWRLTMGADTLDVEQVVIAAGAWSRPLARSVGQNIPLDTERGYHLEFDLPEGEIPLTRPLCPSRLGFYFTPMQGRLRAAGTVELGGRDAAPSPHRWDRLEAGARTVFPDLPPVSRRWMGLRPSLPDSVPVIGAAGPEAPGVFLAFGHGHLGLTLAMRTANLIGDLVAGRKPPIDMAPYSATRFG